MSPLYLKTLLVTGLGQALAFVQRKVAGSANDSLISFTKAARVEPIALVDQRAAHLPYAHDIMQALSSMFTGYYLQAVALTVSVGKINVIKLLDTLNPTRDVGSAMGDVVDRVRQTGNVGLLSMEAFNYKLPVPGEGVSLESDVICVAMESGGAKFGKDTLDTVREATNLSVGKIVEVTIKDGEAEVTYPITVRIISALMDSAILTHILGDGSRDTSVKERWHGWRSGQLEFWRDIVLSSDIIDEHRRTLMKDKSGVYGQILARRTGNKAAGLMTDTPSIGTASNLIVMTKQTAQELEAQVGGKLNNVAIRKKIEQESYVMIMVVVDPEWEQITIYHRGIATPTQLSVKELKASNKGTGQDIGDILKAYQLGQHPTI